MTTVFSRSSFKKLAALPLFLFSIHASSANGIAPEELNFRAQLGLEGYQTVEYKDTKGGLLDFAQFQSMLGDYDFNMKKRKNGDQGFAVVQLKAKEAKPVAPVYKVAPGSAFPSFALHSTDGAVVNNAALSGRYTVISFYFSECAPCVKEVPMLNAFAEKHRDFFTLAVTFDSADEVKQFARRTRFGWRTVASGRDLIEKLGVDAYPTFALLDPHGVLVAMGNQLEVGAKDGGLDKWVHQAINRGKPGI